MRSLRSRWVRWLYRATVPAAVTRIVAMTALMSGVILLLNAGIVPVLFATSGSGAQSIVNAVLVGLWFGVPGVWGLFNLATGRGRRRAFPEVHGHLVYDKSFFAAAPKPWFCLCALATVRGRCHFYAHGADMPVETVVYIVSAATAVWLFVIGPVWRPLNVLCFIPRREFFEGKAWFPDGIP
jgi:hypothetical protein